MVTNNSCNFGTGVSGQVLTSNGNGVAATFQNAGSGSGIATIDGDSGSVTGSTVSIKSASTAGASISFTGSSTAMTLNVTDSNNNTYFGLSCGTSSSSPTNAGFGNLALRDLSGGSGQNACFGYGAGAQITTSSANTAIGYSALIGVAAGSGNTAVGATSLFTLGSSGTNNCAFGIGTLYSLATGSYNLALGRNAGENYSGSESSNIVIANNGVASENNVIRIGTQGTSSGQQNTCYIAGITGSTVTGTAVLCSTSGQLGTISSSKRYKENIAPVPENLSVLDLEPRQFNYIWSKDKEIKYGLIAEEVKEKFPYLCFLNEKGEPESVNYHELPTLLLHEIKKLKKEIDELKNKSLFSKFSIKNWFINLMGLHD